MSQWYFVEDGKPQGPLDEEELIQVAQAGRLQPLDLIFQEGSERWFLARDESCLKSVFQQQTENPDQMVQWVVLKKKDPKEGVGYRQIGPFSKIEIESMLKKGEVEYSDHIWKEGLKKWQKISQMGEWNSEADEITTATVYAVPPLPDSVISHDPSSLNDSSEELLSTVIDVKSPFDRNQSNHDESLVSLTDKIQNNHNRTDEDEYEEITQDFVPLNSENNDSVDSPEKKEFIKERKKRNVEKIPSRKPSENQISESENLPPVVVLREDAQEELKYSIKKWMPGLSWRVFFSMIILTFAASGIWLLYSSKPLVTELAEELNKRKKIFFMDPSSSKTTPVPQSQPPDRPTSPSPSQTQLKTQPQPQSPSSSSTVSATESAPQNQTSVPHEIKEEIKDQTNQLPNQLPKEMKKEPTFLQIQTADWNRSSQQRIIFKTDASSHFTLSVTLIGKAGEILSLPSYWRNWQIKTKRGEERHLLVGPLNLGSGEYQVVAEMAQVKSTSHIFIGKQDRPFQVALMKQKKKISWLYQSERKKLFFLNEGFLEEVKKLNKKGSLSHRDDKEWNQQIKNTLLALRKIQNPELRINPRSVNNYLFPQEWMKLRQWKEQLLSLISQLQNQRTKNNSDSQETLNLLKNKETELSQFSEQIKAMSLWNP